VPAATRSYYVQVATLSSRDRAAALAKSLGGTSAPFKSLWRVRTGPFSDAKSAAQARDAAAARGYGDARVVRED
jgi:rare lipoprotein A